MPFQKGVSGNPGGRPKGYAEIEQLAREHSASAISALVAICKNTKFAPASRVSAATALLDRGFGRPAQRLTHENPDGTPLSIIVATAIPMSEDQPADQPTLQ